ncbi:flagellar hook-length control protein FliK [Virgibacillus sp. W0430]|uniref:flagellar hook-length control protein FliK n=1 Tax=Virgibacillus sp. W0430 TaxID=3391580 RepID=UPI003F48081C
MNRLMFTVQAEPAKSNTGNLLQNKPKQHNGDFFERLLQQKKQSSIDEHNGGLPPSLQQMGSGDLSNANPFFVTDESGLSDDLLRELNKLIQSTDLTDGELIAYLQQMATSQHFEKGNRPIELIDQVVKLQTDLTTPVQETLAITEQLQRLFSKLEQLVAQMNRNNGSMAKLSTEVLQILKEWSTLEQKVTTEQRHQLQSVIDNQSNEQRIVQELIQAYKKRNELVTKQQYRINAQVTSNDIAKWMQSITTNQLGLHQSTINHVGIPMSNTEQYIIYLNKTEGSGSVEQQLIKQFQQSVQSSRFLSGNNGTNQLSFSLRPDHLGDMVVRLTQINGEMTVRILVSSQVAKDMLESNVHQLKNMFAPHQVVVEKDELIIDSKQAVLKEPNEEQSKDEKPSDSDSKDEKERDGQTNNDFKTELFEQMLNEKV